MEFLKRTIFTLCCAYLLTLIAGEKVYTDEFAVHIRGGRSVADELAVKYGYVNKGQIGELRDHYLFQHNRVQRRSVLPSDGEHTFLAEEPVVEWMEQQHIKKRVKRDFIELTERSTDRLSALEKGLLSLDKNKLDKPIKDKPIKDAKLFSDPAYRAQWYMDRSNAPTMNIEEAWKLGYTGAGIVVSILDDGIEMNHPDLRLNFDQQASYDVNGNRKNPSPRYDYADTNRHGTRCAGEVAMQADNKICGVGVAFNASIGGVRMLDGDVTDSVEATSLSHAKRHVDIYSASWGPDDDGRTVDGPGKLAKQAFIEGVKEGRHGLGSIYVWASGNGGHVDDSCNCDGYANSIYTLSISSTSENGASPWYLESCASTLATTYSSGAKQEKKVVTTDLHQKCTDEHTGTSASAPIAAGIVALALQANPTLTWRDVQYLVVKTSRRENLKAGDWTKNGAGYNVSHKYGFGLMDAKAMVQEATTWTSLPEQHVCEVKVIDAPRTIEPGTNIVTITVNTTACAGTDNAVRYLEHVQARMTLTFSKRGALTIRLTSPQKTKSTILPSRRGDQRPGGFNDWDFMSTHYWGEEADGMWVLEVENTGLKTYSGKITEWNLILYGTETPPVVTHQKRPRSNQEDYDPFADESWDDPSWDWDSSSYDDFDDENCHEECWDTGCDGPNPEDCYKCKHYRDRITDKCVQYCPPGQYPPIYLHERCKFCDDDCKTCIGPEAWDCTSCPERLVLSAGECLDECDPGFFEDEGDNLCHRCDDLCTTCKDAPDNCQSCVPGAVLDDTECKYSCPTSYFLQNGQCQPCDPSCETCHGPEDYDCTSCDPDLVHKGQYCVDAELCGEGFYISVDVHGGDVSRECIACHSSCETCDGFSYDDCLTCPADFYLNYGVCEPDCRDGTFKDFTDNECHDCPDGCKLCITETICIACEDQRVLNQGDCMEGCEQGFYEYAGECFPCHDLCQECVDGGLTDCTECKQQDSGNRYLLEGACLPFCPEGYFMDDDSLTCRECDETCRRCDATKCIECMDDGVDAGDDWVCGEDEHTGDCDPSCATCMSDAPDQCLTCVSHFYMHNYKCVEDCPDHYYPDEDRQSCRLCHPTCKTCDGLHIHDCLSCDQEYVLTPVGNTHSTCETHCPDGTYEDFSVEVGENRVCGHCHESCTTCDGPRDADCIACDRGMFLQVNWNTQDTMPERKCVEVCEDGTFGAPDDGECLPCHQACQTCVSTPNHCTACIDGYDLEDNTCKNAEGCRDDQFTNDDGECSNCHFTCETCEGQDATQCLSCDYYRFLTDVGHCEEVCPENTYPDFDLNLCLKCHETCRGCVMGGPSDCLECQPDLYSYPYDGQACVESCPEGFYELQEGDVKTCQQCSLECRDCHESYWQCISCNDGTFLFQDRCVNACPYEYREDAESNHCVLDDDDVRFPCPLNCQECDDWGDCRACDDGYGIYYGECVKKDEQTCPDGKYPMINEQDVVTCQSCDSSCKTCQGPGDDECLSCKTSNQHLNRGICETSCADGTYPHTDDEGTKICLACHPTCKTCDGPAPNECETCDDNLKYDELHQSCHVNCPSHTFFSNGGCEHCDETCGTCDGRTNNDCVTCDNGLYHWVDKVNNNKCLASCPDGTFHFRPSDESTDGYECQECHASCETCFGETDSDCTSCPSNMYRQGFTCQTNCDEGYYPDDGNVCQRCHLTCETCSGANSDHCLSCASELFLQAGYCKESCEQGFYEQPGHKCGQCHPRCMSCSDDGPFECVSCHESYMLVNGTCYNRCKVGDFWNKTSGECKQCDATCLECFGPNKHHCIDCPNGLLLKRLNVNHSSCVRCCGDGEKETEDCCRCNDDQDKCLKAGQDGKGGKDSDSNKSSAHAKLHTGTIVLGVILAVAFFLTIFCVLQARSNKMWCFRDSYDRLPAYYDSKGNHVIMSKQYQHEKINVMSDDEDFYEDIDSEEEED